MSLSIRCGLTIGPARSAGSGGVAPPVVDLSDIDLTAATLDSRIKFSCASTRAYYAAGGTIQFADPDVWPLEYRDGVAVGRHEPEPQSTNYMLDTSTPELLNRALSGGGTLSAERVTEPGIPTARFTFIAPTETSACYSLIGGNTAVGAGDVVYSVFVRSAEPDRKIVLYADALDYRRYDISTDMRRLTVKTSTTNTTRFSWLGLRNLAATLVAEVAGYQVERGQFATSPIITGATAATRAGALAWVSNPKSSATAARIYYTDGTTLDVDFAGTERAAIPASAADWGTRYIEGISYAKGFS